MEFIPANGRNSSLQGNPVFLIKGSEYGLHHRNTSIAAGHEDFNSNLKYIEEYEDKVKNRVQYLENMEKKQSYKL